MKALICLFRGHGGFEAFSVYDTDHFERHVFECSRCGVLFQ